MNSDEMLKELRKGITVADTLNIFSLARRHRVRAFASVMVNLPNETLEQLGETERLLEKIRPSGGVIGTTIPLSKTELFDKYFAHKIKTHEEIVHVVRDHTSDYNDERFHFCKYAVDFKKLVNALMRRYFLFSELRLGPCYWEIFFRSGRKIQYIAALMKGFIRSLLSLLPWA